VPQESLIERVVVPDGFDAADDWIAGRVGPRDIVITADVPLASRCVKAGATVIAPNGRPFTEDTIGVAVAVRDLMTDLRSHRRGDRRPARLWAARPLGLPVRARPGDPALATSEPASLDHAAWRRR
jgi:uncharacterized protein YaiI (UPF0178 family)